MLHLRGRLRSCFYFLRELIHIITIIQLLIQGEPINIGEAQPFPRKKQAFNIVPVPALEDPLLLHIAKSRLNLEMFGEVQRSGNCWYATTYNLSLHHGICPDGVNSPDDLRTKITDSLEFHPSFAATEDASVNDFIWFRDVFGSQVSNVEAFKKQHRTEGMYTDNMGIIVFLTQHLLKVNMKIVSTSCNQAQPFTLHQYMGPGQAVATFNIGHYQDLTHRGGQGGHYHSLREVDTPQVREASRHSDIAFFF